MPPEMPKYPTPLEYIKNRIGTLETEIVTLLEVHAEKDARIATLETKLAGLEKKPQKK